MVSTPKDYTTNIQIAPGGDHAQKLQPTTHLTTTPVQKLKLNKSQGSTSPRIPTQAQ